jgi:hypothetical protein
VTPKASSYERGRREGRGAELRAEGTEGVRAVGVSRPVPAGSVSLHFRGIFEPPTMSKYGIPIVSKGQRRINARQHGQRPRQKRPPLMDASSFLHNLKSSHTKCRLP